MNSEICCIGEVLMDFVALDRSERLLDAGTFQRCAGGAPANVAVGIARLGGRSSIISCVGVDCWGDYLVEVLQKEGVEVRGMQRTSDASTTLAFVSLSKEGERDFSFMRCPGADTRLSVESLDTSLLDECGLLHFGSFGLSSEPSRTATLAAVMRARSNGAVVSLDVNYRASVWLSPEDAIVCVESILPEVDILKVSEEEAELLTGSADPVDAAKQLIKNGPRLVLVSLGSEGCLCVSAAARFKVDAFAVTCVDATGAGDSFIAAFLQRFVEAKMPFDDSLALEDACRFACAAASLTVTGYGAIPALPRRAAVVGRLETANKAFIDSRSALR